MKCAIPLFSGIGNVIQMLPFAFEMKRRYGEINSYLVYLDYHKSTMQLVKGIFKNNYRNIGSVPKGHKIFKYPKKEFGVPEFKAWFISNNEKLPKRFKVDFINYKKVKSKRSVVIWNGCKKNWPCKKWPYYKELASHFGAENCRWIRENKKRTLLTVGGLIKNAKIFIGNDGGISHYSAALGTKTYIIFGGTDPVKNMPPQNGICITKNLPCQPCQFNGMVKKGNIMVGCKKKLCLRGLSIKEVLEKING